MSDNNKVVTKYVGNKASDSTQLNWWELGESEIHNSVNSTLKRINEQQSHQKQLAYKYARLYSDSDILGYLTGLSVKRNSQNKNIVTFNVVSSTIDTVRSKIAKAKPKVQFLTEDGDFGLQTRAKNLTSYVEGVFYDSNVYQHAQKAFTHACVFGTGVLKICKEAGKIKVECIFPEEIKVDNIEGAYGNPRQLHQTTYIPRETLLEQYPDAKYAILAANKADVSRHNNTVADMVKVVHSWYLGSDKSSGKYAVSIENCTLHHEDYKKDYFPFVFFRWKERLAGFQGQGIAEELIGIQIEINKLLRSIQKAQHLVAVPRVAVDASSSVSTQTLSNEIGMIFKYQGNPPSFFTPTAMNAEVYNHLKWLIQSAYEVTGISQLSATSKKPSGLDAAVALREFQDIESERFNITAQRYERIFLELAEKVIDISRDLYMEDPKLTVKLHSSNTIKKIKWKDADLDESQFVMKMFPVSLLPQTPSGRLQKIQELINAGIISQDQAVSLLDFPDLDKVQSLETSSLKLTEKQLYLITEEGKYSEPEPQQNLELCSRIAQQAYLKAKLNNVPEERLELILRYIDDTERLIGLATPEAPTAPVEPTPAPELPTVDTAPLPIG